MPDRPAEPGRLPEARAGRLSLSSMTAIDFPKGCFKTIVSVVLSLSPSLSSSRPCGVDRRRNSRRARRAHAAPRSPVLAESSDFCSDLWYQTRQNQNSALLNHQSMASRYVLVHVQLGLMIQCFCIFTRLKPKRLAAAARPRRRVRYIAADGLPRAPSGAPAVLPRGLAGLLGRMRPLPFRSHGCGLGGLSAVLTAADGGRFVAAPARLLSLFAPRSATATSRASGEATST